MPPFPLAAHATQAKSPQSESELITNVCFGGGGSHRPQQEKAQVSSCPHDDLLSIPDEDEVSRSRGRPGSILGAAPRPAPMFVALPSS